MIACRWFYLFPFLMQILCSTLWGQYVVIKGTIKDEQNKPVAAANVILQLNENTSILAFDITGENGEFTLKISSNLDSAYIIVTHLSYATQKFFINTADSYHEIVLIEQVYKLPELIIKNDPMIRRGDTLIFDVNQYRRDSDQNLEQVISRIPGITIESNGQIKYDGLSISKFYVEGLDMLEGRYRIITRNLRVDAVRDIEIIEHHQPIRALDSLVRPDNAAINLRLKSNIAVTGSLRGGIGANPLLYLGAADIFSFTKKQQFNTSISTNNTGENQSGNFQNFYIKFNDAASNFIKVNQATPPLFAKELYYLDNQELIGGYNYLKKITAYTEFKWQGFARKDRIVNLGAQTLRFNDGSNNFTFEEILNAVERPLELNNRIILEHNAKKVFVRADINTNWQIADTNAENQVNDETFLEQLDKQNINVDGVLSAIIRVKNKAYQIKSNIKYQSTKHDLVLMPADVFTKDFPSARFNWITQIARYERLDSDTYSNVFFKIKDINGRINLGLINQYSFLNTDIQTRDSTQETKSLGQLFNNQIFFYEFTPYVNQIYKREKNNSTWTVHLPLSFSLLSIRNRINFNQSSFNPLVVKPRIDYRLKTQTGNYWGITYSFQRDFERLNNLFFDGHVIQSNRNINTSIFDFNRFSKHEFSVYSQVLKENKKYRISVSLEHSNYDFINNSIFNQLGAVNSFIRQNNQTGSIVFQGNVSGIIGSGIDFDLSATHILSQNPSFINGDKLNILNNTFSLSGSVNYTSMRSVISFKPTFRFASSNLFTMAGYQFDSEIVYFIKITENGSFRAIYHQYITAVSDKQVWNGLLAAEYRHSLLKKKTDIQISINNLLNNNYYITFSQNAFAENISLYRWRPRQVVFSFIKKF